MTTRDTIAASHPQNGRQDELPSLLFKSLQKLIFMWMFNENVTYIADICYYYIKTEFDYAKRDSHRTVYEGYRFLGEENQKAITHLKGLRIKLKSEMTIEKTTRHWCKPMLLQKHHNFSYNVDYHFSPYKPL